MPITRQAEERSNAMCIEVCFADPSAPGGLPAAPQRRQSLTPSLEGDAAKAPAGRSAAPSPPPPVDAGRWAVWGERRVVRGITHLPPCPTLA